MAHHFLIHCLLNYLINQMKFSLRVKAHAYFVLACLAMIFILGSCVYDVESELADPFDCDSFDSSYSLDVVPILEESCYACHSQTEAFGGVVLEGYEALSIWVEDGSFLCSIKHEGGCSPMPQGQPQLAECEIEFINTWIENGAENN